MFSELKLVKNTLEINDVTGVHEHLNMLSLLILEHELQREL